MSRKPTVRHAGVITFMAPKYGLIKQADGRIVELPRAQLRDASWDESLIGRAVSFIISTNYMQVEVARKALVNR